MKSSKNLYKEFLAIYFKYLTVAITINEITKISNFRKQGIFITNFRKLHIC